MVLVAVLASVASSLRLPAPSAVALLARAQPAAFTSLHLSTYKPTGPLKFAKGTTTLAFRFNGGVVVSVDSRSTQGPYIGASPLLRLGCSHLLLCLGCSHLLLLYSTPQPRSRCRR